MGHEYDALMNQAARLAKMEQEMADMHLDLNSVKDAMHENTAALQEYIELSKSFKIGLKFLGLVEATAVWLSKIIVAGIAVWGVWKFLVKEAIANGFSK